MSTKQLNKFEEELDIPDNVQVTYKSKMLQVTGPLGKTHKSFKKIPVDITINEKKIMLKATGTRNKDFAIMRTAKSIIRNICEGVIEPHFDIFANNSILNLPPRLSSICSKSLMYPSFLSVFNTSTANFDVGSITHSDFLLDSVLSIVTNKFAKTLVAGKHITVIF